MGSFSWLKADNLTKIANIVYDRPFHFLVPKEYGGGYISDKYQDYGYLGYKPDGSPKYDMYELIAVWNEEKVSSKLKYNGSLPKMKEIDEFTHHNRIIGIEIGCCKAQVDELKYPLKLVSPSYKGSYEDCAGRSYGDPKQGFGPLYRKELHREFLDCSIR